MDGSNHFADRWAVAHELWCGAFGVQQGSHRSIVLRNVAQGAGYIDSVTRTSLYRQLVGVDELALVDYKRDVTEVQSG